MENQSKSITYIDVVIDDKIRRYITAAGIQQNFGIKDNGKISEVMHFLATEYDYQSNAYFKGIDYPISLNVRDKKGRLVANSKAHRVGSNKLPIQAILYDIWEYYYSSQILDDSMAHLDAPKDNQTLDQRIEAILNAFRDAKVKIGTNRDVVQALIPILDEKDTEIERLKRDYDALQDSIVVRKRTKAEQTFSNPFIPKDEINQAKTQFADEVANHPYLTDATGEQYQAFKQWLDADANHKPMLP